MPDYPRGPFMSLMKVLYRLVRLRRRLRGPLRPTWNAQFETFATFLHHYGRVSPHLPLKVQRRGAEAIVPATRAIAEAEFEAVSANGVPSWWIRRGDSDRGRVVLYLHGGGYTIGSVASHRDFLARVCRATGATVLAPDYRLAPEHPFPAQLEDALAVYRWMLTRGLRPANLAIGGESAGAGLTLSTLLSLRDDDQPLPAAAVLISPWVDLEARSESMTTNARFDYVSRHVIGAFARHFVSPSDRTNPLAAPILADLHGLPPLLIHVGGAEALLDEGLLLARRAREAGVVVELDVWPDMIHAWHILGTITPESAEAIGQIGRFVRRHLGSTAPRPTERR